MDYEIRRYRRWLKTFNEINDAMPDSCKILAPEELALKLAASDVQEKKDTEEMVKEYAKANHPENIETQLITIMIDQKVDEEQAIHIQFQIIDLLKEANYKFMSDCSHRFEYFTKNGWSPHIHILTTKNTSDGKVAQPLRRKLMSGKSSIDEVYRINISTLNFDAHRKYINGEKCESKTEYLEKDAEFKDKHNINDIYYW